MKRCGLILAVILLCHGALLAQLRSAGKNRSAERPRRPDSGLLNKFYFGGGLGGFGTGTSSAGYSYTYYSLFGLVGYRLTDQASLGTGVNYSRFSYPNSNISSYYQYGLSPFFRYNINNLFTQVEYDLINAPILDNTTGTPRLDRKMFSRLLFGIGYSLPLGKRAALNGMVMYDVLYRQPSVFNSPLVVRVFFTI